MQNVEYVLYLLSRNDLPSMTHGKELAQAHHAGVQLASKYYNNKLFQKYLHQGIKSGADHFNTTITLDAGNKENIEGLIAIAEDWNKFSYTSNISGLVIDPSYPYWVDAEVAEANNLGYELKKGNKVLMLREEMTFGYILCNRDSEKFKRLLGNLPLKQYNSLIYQDK